MSCLRNTTPILAELMVDDTFIYDRNILRFNDVLDRARRVFLAGLDSANSVAPSSGGGGTSNDMLWRDKDEDYLPFVHRSCSMFMPRVILGITINRRKIDRLVIIEKKLIEL